MKLEKLKRGDKIYLDKDNTIESEVNKYLECRDGIVEAYEYRDESGYGFPARIFMCQDSKHETVAIIRQTLYGNGWEEEAIHFDNYSFAFLEALIGGKKLDGYVMVRNFADRS